MIERSQFSTTGWNHAASCSWRTKLPSNSISFSFLPDLFGFIWWILENWEKNPFRKLHIHSLIIYCFQLFNQWVKMYLNFSFTSIHFIRFEKYACPKIACLLTSIPQNIRHPFNCSDRMHLLHLFPLLVFFTHLTGRSHSCFKARDNW